VNRRDVLALAALAATMNAKEVRSSRSYVREALEDLAAGRKVATPTSTPFGCAIAYRG
jgi:hypothetical protein